MKKYRNIHNEKCHDGGRGRGEWRLGAKKIIFRGKNTKGEETKEKIA